MTAMIESSEHIHHRQCSFAAKLDCNSGAATLIVRPRVYVLHNPMQNLGFHAWSRFVLGSAERFVILPAPWYSACVVHRL